MRNSWSIAIGALVVAFALAAPVGWAQTTQTGVLQGEVTDPEGRPLADAAVSVSFADGSYPKATETNEDGDFRIGFLPPGAYVVTATAAGYQPTSLSSVRVSAGSSTRVELALRPGLQEEVEVVAAPLAIDVVTTESPLVLESEEIELLPITRDPNDLINFTPGARSTSVWGATNTQANTYRFDGVSVDQPGFGGSFLIPNIDWIEEFQVRGLGAGAEFGNFQGGFVNIVTKSGSNTFEANARANYSSESLNASNVNVEELGAETDRRWEINADVSGPILRDELYYFFSVQRIQDDTRVLDESADGVAFLSTLEERTEDKLFGKLTWQASDKDTFNLTLGWDGVTTDNRGIDAFTRPEATVEQDSPSWFYGLNYTRTFNDSLFLEAKLTGYDGEDERTPYNGDLPSVEEIFARNNRLFRNALFTREQKPESLGLAVNLDWFVPTGSVLHHFKIGGETTRGKWEESRLRHAGYAWRVEIFNDPDLGDPPFDPTNADTWLGLISTDFGDEIRLDAETENSALYVQDYMQINDHLSVSAGLRWNKWEGTLTPGFLPGPNAPGIELPPTGTGEFEAVSDDAFDPRVGLIVDFGGDGRWVAKAHWGRYHQSLIAVMFDRVTGANTFTDLVAYDWAFPDGRVPTPSEISEPLTLEDVETDPRFEFFDVFPAARENGPVVDYDQPYVDQLVLSLEHAINDRLRVGLTYVNRKNENIIALVDRNLASNYTRIENVEVFDFGTGAPVAGPDGNPLVLPEIFVANEDIFPGDIPGVDPADLTFDQDFALTNAPGAERELDQIHLDVDYRGENLSVGGSIVWSDLEGNYNSVSGYADQGGLTGAGPYVTPNEQINFDGDLPRISEWEVKLRGFVRLPLAFRVGAFFRYFSGDKYTPSFDIDSRALDFVLDGDFLDPGLFSGVDGDRIYLEDQGSREYESEWTLDLRADKVFRIGDLEWIVALDVFNVFNNDSVRLRETFVNDTLVGEPSPGLAYDTVRLRQPPREVRVTTSVHW